MSGPLMSNRFLSTSFGDGLVLFCGVLVAAAGVGLGVNLRGLLRGLTRGLMSSGEDWRTN